MRDIDLWLTELGLAKYVSAFAEAEVDFETLPELSETDLKELGLPLGPRRKILAALKRPPDRSETPAVPVEKSREAAQPQGDSAQAQDPERRHLTVMFVDLVGSTRLSSRLDVEDMRAVMTTYQDAVAGIVSRFEGFVAKFMGDGVLCYFGWPRANEDDAERAVRAGRSIIETVRKNRTPDGDALATRIGIATGIVIVGDLVGTGAAQEAAVVGDTPNLAARLQACALPDQLVIAAETRRLLGNTFQMTTIGSQTLKGIEGTVEAYTVEGEISAQSRFAARQSGTLTPIVGRDREIELIVERWALAMTGQGQMIIVSGEAGIGKSRITHAVVDAVSGNAYTRMTCQCSPYHSDSAFYPIAQQIAFSAEILPTDTNDTRLQKLESLLGPGHEAMPFVAPLVGAEPPAVAGIEDLTSVQRRARTMEALTALLVQYSKEKPVLLVFEDLQWVDPTSLEFLDVLLDEIAGHRIMVLGTARPTFEYGFGGHPIVTRFVLNRLGQEQIAAIVGKLTGGRALPEEIMSIIAARTDGVPLFVEELTKTILESDALQDGGDRMVLSGPISTIAIPATLQDSLMARLDRLQPIKEVAQTAACIGREFGHALLARISPLDEDGLCAALDGLIKAELIYRRGVPPEASYLFKHALLRDAAYESLLKERRRAIHARIAHALDQEELGWGVAEPEALAHHFTEAAMPAEAIPLWRKAARNSMERSADREAAEHLRKALQLLADRPDDEARRRVELDALTALSLAIMNTSGSGSPEVRQTLLRADALSRKVADPALAFPVTWGLWINSAVSGRIGDALGYAETTLDLAQATGKQDFLLQAHHAAWTSQMALGDFNTVVRHAGEGWRLYDPDLHANHRYVYGGHDPGACAASHLALSNWFLGYPDRSQANLQDALDLARAQGHSHTIAVTLLFVAMTDLFSRNGAQAIARADELIAMSEAENQTIWVLNGQILRHWARAEFDRPDAVVDAFREALAARESTGSRLRQPVYLGGFARALLLSGHLDEAETTIKRAMTLAQETGEQTWRAYLKWTEAEIVRALHKDDTGPAEALYRETMATALEQSARSIALRAATGLATLRPDDDDAAARLQEIHGTFREGFDTPDLKDAADAIGTLL